VVLLREPLLLSFLGVFVSIWGCLRGDCLEGWGSRTWIDLVWYKRLKESRGDAVVL
jgi:hypothetical protein